MPSSAHGIDMRRPPANRAPSSASKGGSKGGSGATPSPAPCTHTGYPCGRLRNACPGTARNNARQSRRGQASPPLGRQPHGRRGRRGTRRSLAMAAPLCRAAAFRPTPYPSATGDRASEAILRPADSPKCPWDVRETASEPGRGRCSFMNRLDQALCACSPARQILRPCSIRTRRRSKRSERA